MQSFIAPGFVIKQKNTRNNLKQYSQACNSYKQSIQI